MTSPSGVVVFFIYFLYRSFFWYRWAKVIFPPALTIFPYFCSFPLSFVFSFFLVPSCLLKLYKSINNFNGNKLSFIFYSLNLMFSHNLRLVEIIAVGYNLFPLFCFSPVTLFLGICPLGCSVFPQFVSGQGYSVQFLQRVT
jgi:hypothetical protein